MSIAEFSTALKSRANAQVTAQATTMLNQLVSGSISSFKSSGGQKYASVLTKGKALIKGKEASLTDSFRSYGEGQGRTRLVLTEDGLQDMFKELNISCTNRPIDLYLEFLRETSGNKYRGSHFEFYKNDGSIIEGSKSSLSNSLPEDTSDIKAMRGLNFSHNNTLKHMADFLGFINAFPGKSTKEIQKVLSGSYDRGHVYAQTTGRTMVSIKDITDEESILVKIVELSKLLDEGSSGINSEKYGELLSRAEKDFSSSRMYMNIEFQLKRNEDKTGNRDTGDISGVLRTVGLLQSLIQNSQLSANGKKLIGTPIATSLKEFAKALDSYGLKLEKYEQQITNVISQTTKPDFLINLRTSDNIKEFIGGLVIDVLSGKGSNRKVKASTPSIQVLKQSLTPNTKVVPIKVEVSRIVTEYKKSLNNIKQEVLKVKKVSLRSKQGQFTSLASLQTLLNQALSIQIRKNMGTGSSRNVLNNRTGRLSESAKVDRMSQSREGMITAFYSYMKYPYATFSEGGRQESPRSRDPKLLISKSIREIASTLVGNRMRAVNI